MNHQRRRCLSGLIAGSLAPVVGRVTATERRPPRPDPALRAIPSTGRRVPAIGMGTWITFDLAPGTPGTDERVAVTRAFFDHGGAVIDSSPMYGHAEAMIGHALTRSEASSQALFAASKLWTPIDALAETQMMNTESLWGVDAMDLMQVHNLVDWPDRLARLREWQRDGRIAHLGVTTSHGRRHMELERVLATEPLDTVQLTLNLRDREAERRLLPLAADRGVAVIVNRPLRRGALPRELAARPLAPLASELGCTSWAQFCLLYVISHPAVTCAIPATSRVDHVIENLAVMSLEMPDARTRAEMARAVA